MDMVRSVVLVKLKEYLAVGKPVVTTWFEELRNYEAYVRVARDAESFAQAMRDAIAEPDDPERLRERVRGHTWESKAELVLEKLAELGIVAVGMAGRLSDRRGVLPPAPSCADGPPGVGDGVWTGLVERTGTGTLPPAPSRGEGGAERGTLGPPPSQGEGEAL